jgi:hypothetical protein
MERVPNANANLIVSLYFIMKMLPMIISGICVYLGYKLFILGVTGQASLSIEAKTVSGQLLNAAPGLFFAIGGIVALIISIVKGVKIGFNNGNGIGMDIRNDMFSH